MPVSYTHLDVYKRQVSDFSAQIASLTEQSAQVQAQLGEPTQITAPQTGYFIRSSATGRLNAGADDILALNTTDLQAYLTSCLLYTSRCV